VVAPIWHKLVAIILLDCQRVWLWLKAGLKIRSNRFWQITAYPVGWYSFKQFCYLNHRQLPISEKMSGKTISDKK
jgi:hypothetical protein